MLQLGRAGCLIRKIGCALHETRSIVEPVRCDESLDCIWKKLPRDQRLTRRNCAQCNLERVGCFGIPAFGKRDERQTHRATSLAQLDRFLIGEPRSIELSARTVYEAQHAKRFTKLRSPSTSKLLH